LGLTHLGFASTDIHEDYQRLRQQGVKFYRPPIEYRPHVWNAYFYGPDGETCELRQFTG
jgi:4-hydroxyphenylpyruvate dioxygenase-like putative hemolysin